MSLARLIVWQLGIEDFVVAGVYAFQKDYARMLYWAAAGTITLATLYLH